MGPLGPKQHREKVRANFCLLPRHMSQESNRHCSEKLVQINLFILGGFLVWIFLLRYLERLRWVVTAAEREDKSSTVSRIPAPSGPTPEELSDAVSRPITISSGNHFQGKVGKKLPKFRSRPGKPNQRKGQNEKFMNFAHFCEFWCFSLGKQARFTLNFCSGTPLRKVHELTFFGLVCRGHS